MALGGPNSYTSADLRTRTGTASPRWPRPAREAKCFLTYR
jgi:hypothetical protein